MQKELQKIYACSKYKTIIFWGISLFTIITIGLLSGGVNAESSADPHDFKKEENCDRCHLSQSKELKFDTITVCLRCHPSNLGDHIINVVPAKAILPDGLPLAKDGKMVCYSCHDYHNRTGIAMMLWVDYKALCITCHVGY